MSAGRVRRQTLPATMRSVQRALRWLWLGGLLASAAYPQGWDTYGGDAGGQRYSSATEITRANVAGLKPAWVYHTGALKVSSLSVNKSDFEATPILFEGTLYLSTPFDRVIALDPETGVERWTYDPKLPNDLMAANYTSRGVASWKDGGDSRPACSRRIFVATLDARLIAIDAMSGKLCDGFGAAGQVDLKAGIATGREHPYRFFGNTSPPTVVGDVVVVGSAIADNVAVEAEPGVVRGFDARTGRLLWSWDPIPWSVGQHPRTSAANAWSVIAADTEHGLIYVPTGAPSPDFYGGFRPGDDKDANSLVALDAKSGRKVWAFQLVHHDVWDYDVAAEPLLFEFHGHIPAVAVTAKTGIVFAFNRLTGAPLYPIEERAVPQEGVAGERLSKTQPFSSLPSLNPLMFDRVQVTGHGLKSQATCEAKWKRLRYDGIFTPPTLGGTLQFPGSLGGVNWGSMALDPVTGILYANTNGSAYEIKLMRQPTKFDLMLQQIWLWGALAAIVFFTACWKRRSVFSGVPALLATGSLILLGFYFNDPSTFDFKRNHNLINSPDSVGETSADLGAPYRIYRRVLQDDEGRPCTPVPWGSTAALNLNTGTMVWRKPLGTTVAGGHTGTVSLGGPIVTAGGLLFTAGTSEPLLRAINAATGEEVWVGKLPVPAQSTPMAYVVHGRQYVVVSAGGHGGLGTPLGDSVVAFALGKP